MQAKSLAALRKRGKSANKGKTNKHVIVERPPLDSTPPENPKFNKNDVGKLAARNEFEVIENSDMQRMGQLTMFGLRILAQVLASTLFTMLDDSESEPTLALLCKVFVTSFLFAYFSENLTHKAYDVFLSGHEFDDVLERKALLEESFSQFIKLSEFSQQSRQEMLLDLWDRQLITPKLINKIFQHKTSNVEDFASALRQLDNTEITDDHLRLALAEQLKLTLKYQTISEQKLTKSTVRALYLFGGSLFASAVVGYRNPLMGLNALMMSVYDLTKSAYSMNRLSRLEGKQLALFEQLRKRYEQENIKVNRYDKERINFYQLQCPNSFTRKLLLENLLDGDILQLVINIGDCCYVRIMDEKKLMASSDRISIRKAKIAALEEPEPEPSPKQKSPPKTKAKPKQRKIKKPAIEKTKQPSVKKVRKPKKKKPVIIKPRPTELTTTGKLTPPPQLLTFSAKYRVPKASVEDEKPTLASSAQITARLTRTTITQEEESPNLDPFLADFIQIFTRDNPNINIWRFGSSCIREIYSDIDFVVETLGENYRLPVDLPGIDYLVYPKPDAKYQSGKLLFSRVKFDVAVKTTHELNKHYSNLCLSHSRKMECIWGPNKGDYKWNEYSKHCLKNHILSTKVTAINTHHLSAKAILTKRPDVIPIILRDSLRLGEYTYDPELKKIMEDDVAFCKKQISSLSRRKTYQAFNRLLCEPDGCAALRLMRHYGMLDHFPRINPQSQKYYHAKTHYEECLYRLQFLEENLSDANYLHDSALKFTILLWESFKEMPYQHDHFFRVDEVFKLKNNNDTIAFPREVISKRHHVVYPMQQKVSLLLNWLWEDHKEYSNPALLDQFPQQLVDIYSPIKDILMEAFNPSTVKYRLSAK